MKNLLLLRHAKSDWSDADLSDHDRPLNKRGRRDAPRMGRLIHDEGLIPDLILVSTAVRAQETVQAIRDRINYQGSVKASRRLYLASPWTILELLRGSGEAAKCVMVVGHNPGLEELVTCLTGTHVRLPTAALISVDLTVEHWTDMTDAGGGSVRSVWCPRDLT